MRSEPPSWDGPLHMHGRCAAFTVTVAAFASGWHMFSYGWAECVPGILGAHLELGVCLHVEKQWEATVLTLLPFRYMTVQIGF